MFLGSLHQSFTYSIKRRYQIPDLLLQLILLRNTILNQETFQDNVFVLCSQ